MSWFTVLRLLLYRSVLELFSKSFKVFHCSVINVRCCYFQQLVYFIISSSRCQQLFYFSLLSFQATACSSYHQRSALSTTFLFFFVVVSSDSLFILPPAIGFVNNFFFPSRSFSRTDCRIPCRLLSLLFFCMCRCISDSLLIIALLPAEVNTFRADLSK